MSKRSRQRQARRLEAQKRREQAALQRDLRNGEGVQRTIGMHIERLMMQKMGEPMVDDDIQPSIPMQSDLPLAIAPPVVTAVPAIITSLDWPECPSTCDAEEWRLALENRDYYLKCAEQDGYKKPWFQYPRVANQYSQFVYISPEMAEELLKWNPINRKIITGHIDALRRDIQNHRWLQTHESIAINKLGNMHDGQHRALAIIKAGVPWPIYVTWNVPPSGIYATDSGNKRGAAEKLAMLFPDLKMTHKTAALCRSMMGGLTNRGIRYTESEIADFMLKHKKVVNWTFQAMKSHRADLQAVIGKSLLWWGEAVVGPFVERLRTIQFCGEGDPAKALYVWLQNSRKQGRQSAYVGPVIYYKKALGAITAHAMKRDAKKVVARDQDVFEWLPGWEVPEDAPCQGKVFLRDDTPPEDEAQQTA